MAGWFVCFALPFAVLEMEPRVFAGPASPSLSIVFILRQALSAAQTGLRLSILLPQLPRELGSQVCRLTPANGAVLKE